MVRGSSFPLARLFADRASWSGGHELDTLLHRLRGVWNLDSKRFWKIGISQEGRRAPASNTPGVVGHKRVFECGKNVQPWR